MTGAAKTWTESDLLLGAIGTLAVIAIWEAAVRTGFVDPQLFPSPLLAIQAAAERLTAETVAGHLWWSLFRVFSGFVLGAIAGAVIGIAAGWYRPFGFVARPLIELLRPIPPRQSGVVQPCRHFQDPSSRLSTATQDSTPPSCGDWFRRAVSRHDRSRRRRSPCASGCR